MKKLLALLLALLMLVGVLVGCAGDTDTKEPDDSNKPSEGDKTPDEGDDQPSGEIPTLQVYLLTTGNYQLWEGSEAEKLANEITEREIGCHFKINWLSYSDYTEKVVAGLAAQEPMDVLYNCYWQGITHKDLVAQGALIPLDDYLKEGGLMEDAYLQSGDTFVSGGTINGHCYGLASIQRNYRYTTVWFNKALAEQYNLVEQINAIENYDDLLAVLDAADKVADDGVQLFYGDGGGPLYGLDITIDDDGYIKEYSEIIQTSTGLVLDSDRKTVMMSCDNAYMDRMSKNSYTMYQKGYLNTEVDATAALSLGQNNMLFGGTYKWDPVWETSVARAYGIEPGVVGHPVGVVWSELNEFEQSQLGITIFSKHPDLAAKWINLVYSSKKFYNCLLWGAEGTDYTLDDQGRVIYDLNNSYHIDSWTIGNNYNGIVDDTYIPDYWEQVAVVNDQMAPMYLSGFYWDTSNNQDMETTRGACNAVTGEYWGGSRSTPLLHSTDKSYEDLKAEYKNAYMQAGGQTLIDYIQGSVDEFLATYR